VEENRRDRKVSWGGEAHSLYAFFFLGKPSYWELTMAAGRWSVCCVRIKFHDRGQVWWYCFPSVPFLWAVAAGAAWHRGGSCDSCPPPGAPPWIKVSVEAPCHVHQSLRTVRLDQYREIPSAAAERLAFPAPTGICPPFSPPVTVGRPEYLSRACSASRLP